MGYLKSVGTSIIYIGAFLAAITFIPGLPPYTKFDEYSSVPARRLTGDLDLNERLHNAQFLFKGQMKGPEDIASFNGELYTGIHGGYIIKITDHKIVPIVKFGKECDGLWQEEKCGRPLGLKFDKKGALYACDAYYGIFKVDVKTGKYETIVNSEEPIEGKKPKIINAVDIASNGDLYWSDSDIEFTVEDGLLSSLTNPSGRLIRYDAATKKNQVLVHNLGFANGVSLSKDEDFVIVAETASARITKYNLRGPKAGKREIFIEGLPGMPDNIHSDNKGGFLVSLFYADQEHPHFFQSLQPHPYIRKMIARFLIVLEIPFKYLQLYYPNYYSEAIVHYLGGFESAICFVDDVVAILRIDNNGKIVDAAYSTNGELIGISSAHINNEFLWLGSPWSETIARVPLKQAFPSLYVGSQIESQESLKKSTSNKKSDREQIPKPVESKSSTSNTPKQTESKPSTEIPKTVESKSSKSDSKTTSNQQKSSHSHGKNSPKK